MRKNKNNFLPHFIVEFLLIISNKVRELASILPANFLFFCPHAIVFLLYSLIYNKFTDQFFDICHSFCCDFVSFISFILLPANFGLMRAGPNVIFKPFNWLRGLARYLSSLYCSGLFSFELRNPWLNRVTRSLTFFVLIFWAFFGKIRLQNIS